MPTSAKLPLRISTIEAAAFEQPVFLKWEFSKVKFKRFSSASNEAENEADNKAGKITLNALKNEEF